MNYKSALVFCAIYFILSYLSIAIEGIFRGGNFVAAANIAVLVIAIRISIFKEWLTSDASWGSATTWSLFSSAVTMVYLHTLPYIASNLFNVSFDRLDLAWTIGLFVFNFSISIACLKLFQSMTKTTRKPLSEADQ